MSYLDLLTDDIMLNILDTRCDDIEKEIKKLEYDIFGYDDDILGKDIFDYDGNGLYLRFDNVVLDEKINDNEIFNPFHIGKTIFITSYVFNNLNNNIYKFDSSDIVINPNYFIYTHIAYKRMQKKPYFFGFRVEKPRFIKLHNGITYFGQRIVQEDEEDEDYNEDYDSDYNDDEEDEELDNQLLQDEIYLNNLSSNI